MNIKLTLESIQYKYKHLNIKCISTIYLDNKHKLNWICLVCNNQFTISINSLDRKIKDKHNICKKCTKIKKLNKAQKICKQKGGKCLSSEYKHSYSKLKCKCKNNHIFNISYNNLVNIGNWCSHCSQTNLVSENICRAYFEAMFGECFTKIRPLWLKNDRGFSLELDGYCEKLKLAFEHNGEYHFYDKKKWRNLDIVQKNDSIKIELCKKYDVKLIVIPSLFKKVQVNNLRQFIINKCNNLGVHIPYEDAYVDLSNCYNDDDIFKSYKQIATDKGGKCLSKEFLGSSTQKMIWECKYGHQWKQFAYVIKKGSWCPVCVGQKHSNNIIKDLMEDE